jgi:hypothetical protein
LLSLHPEIHSIRTLQPRNPIKYGHRLLLPVYLEPRRVFLGPGDPLPPWTSALSTLDIGFQFLSWRCIAPLFHLPVLKALILTDGRELTDGAENWINGTASPSTGRAILARSSPVEELDFGRCTISSTAVANAVSTFKTLCTLRHMYCIEEEEGKNLRLYKGLYEHANTLHTLKACC